MGIKHEAGWVAKAAVLGGAAKPDLCSCWCPLDARTGWRKLWLLEGLITVVSATACPSAQAAPGAGGTGLHYGSLRMVKTSRRLPHPVLALPSPPKKDS